MNTPSKLEICNMFWKTDPDRFSIKVSPWCTYILIDKCWDYYDTPKE